MNSTTVSTGTENIDRSATMIRLHQARVTFDKPEGGTHTVLHDIDLDIAAGQFVALVGRSGCGKTTLLNMIAALVEPSSGSIQVHGTSPREARPHLGFMLARDALLPWRSAQGNVEYGLELRGIDRATRRKVAHDWLGRVHLGGSERLWPWQLSQGMRQRVALARTWALDPDVLLMDEPFAALDARTRISVQQQFLELWQSGPQRTVVFVTHDLGEAITLADRVVLLGEGKILDDVEVGIERPRDLESVAAHPRYQELYERFRASL
ncbi:ABC transporter ATP-binding protein [Rhodococcus sp. RCBS9]|uniref:ABC transporter ATP-binding protein n=1 Tax=Rhodococcus sp. RCBS9 TaxID=3031999 RepID=UPI0023F87BE4|nr:ABC transporter ATP-binding protein [Rhodococcus sp. RCBS9]WEX01072.1 ABC transporter ATP-binding protein [Rhodococcus sp. RCBS9]